MDATIELSDVDVNNEGARRQAHIVDRLGGKRGIFDANPARPENDWLTELTLG